jgi:hypothetical protein
MKNRFACIGLITAMFLLTVGIAAVMAASVNPTIINNFQSGDAFFECREVGCSCNHAYKFDNCDEHEFSAGSWQETMEVKLSPFMMKL